MSGGPRFFPSTVNDTTSSPIIISCFFVDVFLSTWMTAHVQPQSWTEKLTSPCYALQNNNSKSSISLMAKNSRHITETRPHRAQRECKSAEETNKTTKTQWWRQGEMKNGGKERQSLAHKNPAVRRCEAEPQSRWHREKEVTCGADEVRMKKETWGKMWKMKKMTNMLLCNTSILSTMNTELRAEE